MTMSDTYLIMVVFIGDDFEKYAGKKIKWVWTGDMLLVVMFDSIKMKHKQVRHMFMGAYVFVHIPNLQILFCVY